MVYAQLRVEELEVITEDKKKFLSRARRVVKVI